MTISFGLRNVTNRDQALSEAFRILKPGGRFCCLEFSAVQNAALAKLYDLWSFKALPQIGRIVARDEAPTGIWPNPSGGSGPAGAGPDDV